MLVMGATHKKFENHDTWIVQGFGSGLARLWTISLALLMTAEVCNLTHDDLEFSQHSLSTFYNFLFPDKFHDDHRRRETDVYHIYTIDEALELLQNAVSAYYDLPRKSVDQFMVNAPAKMYLTVFDPPPRLAGSGEYEEVQGTSRELHTSTHILSEEDPLGPFRNDSQVIIRSLSVMDLELHWSATTGEGGDFRTFEWEVHLIWDFAHRGGRIDMYMAAAASLDARTQAGRSMWMDVLLAALASLSLVHNIWPRGILRHLPMVSPSESGEPWSAWRAHRCLRDILLVAFIVLDLHCMHSRPTVFRTKQTRWRQATRRSVGRVGSAAAQSAARSALDAAGPTAIQHFLVWLEVYHGVHLLRCIAAVGSFWAWICVCETGPRQSPSLLWQILVSALPQVVSFLWASLPMYLAFASLGMVLFAEHAPSKFGSLLAACASLFSLLNGDVLMETMLELEAAGMLVSRLYVCGFICVFVFVVLNAVLCVIQDAFRQAKRTADLHPG